MSEATRNVELVDAGELRRLERFGPLVVDRPAPTATAWRRAHDAWAGADLRFDPGPGWSGRAVSTSAEELVAPWPVEIEGLTMELRPTASGGLGLFPEHAANLGWLGTQVDRLATADHPTPSVLHLFAHTGLLSLGLARAGAAVVHVDSARTVVAWARRNAERSGLADRPIRWLVDDALAFVRREVRRGHRYDGIVLDPPSFGHAGRRRWRLADELPDLLAGCAALLDPNGFLLMTAHTTGLDGACLGEAVRAVLPAGARHVTVEPLGLDATSGARLDLGWSVRLGAG